jgi:hypothetical protein
MTDVSEPTIGTVTFYVPSQGHGIAITRLGKLQFEIPFRRENRREVEFADGKFVWGDNLRDQIPIFEFGVTEIVMQVTWTDTQTIRAGYWGFVPQSYLYDNSPNDTAPEGLTVLRQKPRRKRHKKKPKPI